MAIDPSDMKTKQLPQIADATERDLVVTSLAAYAAQLQRQIDKETNAQIRELRSQDRDKAIQVKQRLQAMRM